jgi:hypothetical protein
VTRIARNYKNLKHNSIVTNWRYPSPPRRSSADMPAKITGVIIARMTRHQVQEKAILLLTNRIAQLPSKMADKM